MTELVDVVEVYRNLDGSYAIRRVHPPSLERVESLVLKDVELVINGPGQAAARKSGVRSAHAFAQGELANWVTFADVPLSEQVPIRYEHDVGFYVIGTNEVITKCKWMMCHPDVVRVVLCEPEPCDRPPCEHGIGWPYTCVECVPWG